MKVLKFYFLCCVAVSVCFLPRSGALQASQKDLANSYVAYPTPLVKPLSCKQAGYNDANISQKQAVVAALGLYLGVKRAAAPLNNKENIQTEHCA